MPINEVILSFPDFPQKIPGHKEKADRNDPPNISFYSQPASSDSDFL